MENRTLPFFSGYKLNNTNPFNQEQNNENKNGASANLPTTTTSARRPKTNSTQFAYLCKAMKSQPLLAMGKEEKNKSDQLWQQISAELNNRGPPVREIKNWKGVWNTLRSNEIKRKQLARKQSLLKTQSINPIKDIPKHTGDLKQKSSSTDCRCSAYKKKIDELKTTIMELRKKYTKTYESNSELKDKIIQLQDQELMKRSSGINNELNDIIIQLQAQELIKRCPSVELPILRRLTEEFVPESSGKCDSVQDILPPEKIKTEKI